MKYAKTIGTALLLASLLAACGGGGGGGGGAAPPPPAGALDTTFNTTGKVTTAIGAVTDDATAVAIQADGKIVAAGYSDNGADYDFALTRYNADGTLDTTFNTTGKVTTAIGSGHDVARAVAIQSDGKIVVAGYSWNGSNYDFALVRYRADGSVDTMGLCFPAPCTPPPAIVTTPIGSGTADQAYALAIQGDGKIVVAGSSWNGSNSDFALVRYSNELFGITLDTTFDTDGIVTTPIGSGADQAYALAIQGNGKIVVAGFSSNGSNYDFALTRYNTDGTLDTTFNGTGKATTAIGSSNDYAAAVAIQGDGKIVAAGYSAIGASYEFALTRYNADGSLDTSFNTTGKATTAIGSGNDYAVAVAIQADGKIVAAGYSDNGADFDFALARYWP